MVLQTSRIGLAQERGQIHDKFSFLEMLISSAINECDPTFSVVMKKSSLALLSSPALLASFLLSVYPAQADTIQSNITNQDDNLYMSSVVITKTNQATNSNSQSLDDRTNILTSDRVGDLAISNLGCDCMGCRQAVTSLLTK